METLQNLELGLLTALQWHNLVACFTGALLGTIIGILPGVGAAATIALLMPTAVVLPADTALIMMAGIFYGAQYGGSITAILVNVPGEGSSAITALDGYNMAKQGRAGPALAAAAISSFIAGTLTALIIALFAAPLTRVALSFGAPEYFATMLLGLIFCASISGGSMLNALAMVLFGIMLGLIGTDVFTVASRFTFGIPALRDGIDIVTFAIALFGISDILINLATGLQGAAGSRAIDRVFPSRADLGRIIMPSLRGTGIGALMGVLPGGGATLSSFAAYAIEKRVSRTPEKFGTGHIEGVAAPEAANNAGAQTSFIPLLTLGIPGNAVTALMAGALMIQGIVPGPQVAINQPQLFWGFIASMWVGNVILLVLNLPLVRIWVALLRIPYATLVPWIIVFACVGAYSVNNNTADVYMMAAISVIGLLVVRFGCQPVPILLGFILGPLIEENLRRSLVLSDGDFSVLFTRPISGTLMAASILLLLLMAYLTRRKMVGFRKLVEDDV
ncbi:MAG: tripartite tricarboxylate transporter permease [Rhizobiaceae bacterium]